MHSIVPFVVALALSCSRTEDAADGQHGLEESEDRNSASIAAEVMPVIPFQENDGQWPEDVVFKVDHFAGSLWVTRDSALVHSLLGPVLATDEGATPIAAAQAAQPAPQPVSDSVRVQPPLLGFVPSAPSAEAHREQPRLGGPPEVVRGPGWTLVERFVGGGPIEAPRGLEPSVTNVSYFIGNDESKWAPQVSTFGALTFGQVWPGVEVRLVARGRNVEKFFHVQPGSDASVIGMALEGVARRDVRVSSTGTLVVHTGNGDVEFTAPVAFQQTASGARESVVVRYQLTNNGYGFSVGSYDRTRELVIDPTFQSTYLGGAGEESLWTMSLNSANEVVVAGYSFSTPFPGTTGGAQSALSGGSDWVVSRINIGLTAVLQSTYLGGSNDDSVGNLNSVAFNATNEIILAGYTKSTDFPFTAGSAQPTFGGGAGDMMICRIGASLTSVPRCTYLGGNAEDCDPYSYICGERAHDILVEASGDILVTGFSYATSFPGVAGGAQSTYGGNADWIVARLNGSLATLKQSTYIGGNTYDAPNQIMIDQAGSVIVAGYTFSYNFPNTATGAQPAFAGGARDGVMTRLNSALTSIERSTYIGGSAEEYGSPVLFAIGADRIIAGFHTNSSSFPATSTGAQATFGGGTHDLALTLLKNDLTVIDRSTYFGGNGHEGVGSALLLDANTLVVTGYTESTNLPMSAGGIQASRSGPSDGFVARVATDLRTIQQSTYWGGSSGEAAHNVFASGGVFYLSGWTQSSDLPNRVGGAQAALGGGYDGFVSMLGLNLTASTGGCTTDLSCSGATPFCKIATGVCVACISDSNCSDGNSCTTDTCNTTTNVCSASLVAGCCMPGGSCNDLNACTTDTCSAPSTNFVANGDMNGGTLTTPPTSWTGIPSFTAQSIGVGSPGSNLGFGLPASQNVSTASPSGGTFTYITQGGVTPGIQQTLAGLTVGQRYRVRGHYQMSPATTAARSLTTQVRAGATTYTLGRVTQ